MICAFSESKITASSHLTRYKVHRISNTYCSRIPWCMARIRSFANMCAWCSTIRRCSSWLRTKPNICLDGNQPLHCTDCCSLLTLMPNRLRTLWSRLRLQWDHVLFDYDQPQPQSHYFAEHPQRRRANSHQLHYCKPSHKHLRPKPRIWVWNPYRKSKSTEISTLKFHFCHFIRILNVFN